MRWNLKALHKELREVVADPSNRLTMYDRSMEEISRALAGTASDTDLTRCMSSLSYVSTWLGRLGALNVLDEASAGWNDLRRSALYMYWHLRFFIHRYDLLTKRIKTSAAGMTHAALCVGHLLSVGEDTKAEWLSTRLANSLQDGALARWPQWKNRGTPFEPFMICVANLWKGVPARQGLPAVADLGVYSEMIDGWSDEGSGIGKAIEHACDYHTMRIDDRAGNDFPEFMEYFYSVFPVEIIAVRCIRDKLGLQTPSVEHPLLSSSLAHPLFVASPVEDPTLTSLIVQVKQKWPGF